MKSISFLLLSAAAVRAFVLPDVQVFEQLSLEAVDNDFQYEDPINSLMNENEDNQSGRYEAYDDEIRDDWEDEFDLGDRPGHHHDKPSLSIYQLIKESKHTTKFAELVDKFDGIVKLLNSTKVNYTLFVPTDEAFDHVPKDAHPDDKFLESLVSYHIGLGNVPAIAILGKHTIATALNESWLGGEAQRLRTRFGLGGVKVNFVSKVVAADIRATNGFIHAVSHILVPPPLVGRELTLLPTVFSTLLLAYEKTDFVSFIHGVKANGTTVFAPTNRAFAALGLRANAFLFNTDLGKKYLRALLKYQIVANATLYSDAFYSNDAAVADPVAGKNGHYRVDLPTLLGDKSITVNFARFGGIIRLRVNGRIPVVVQDGIAKNGVIQAVGRVPLPPHRHGKSVDGEGEISVEDLKDLLAEYIDEDDKSHVGDL